MTLPRIPRRLVLLLVAVALIGGGLGVAYMVRKQQSEARILALRGTGMAAYAEADYGKTLADLGTFLRRYPTDVEALLAYGRSREKVQSSKNQHIPQAIGVYRRVLELDPENDDVRRDLLRLYQSVRYHTETVKVATEILARNPRDLAALQAHARSLAAMREFKKSLDAAEQTVTAHPLDLESHLLIIQLKRALTHPPAEIIAYAQQQAKAHPNDPRFDLIEGVAHNLTGDREKAKACLHKAAQSTLDDTAFYRALVIQLDQVGEYAASTATLAKAAKANAGVDYRRLYATRLWQSGLVKDLIDLLRDVSPEDPAADSQLLVFKALALNQPATHDQVSKIAAALAKRPATDTVAAAWGPLFNDVLLVASPKPEDVIKATDAALAKLPGEPHILFLRATAHLAQGETLRAIHYWEEASNAAPAWPLPRVRLARGFTQMGRGDDGFRVARDALLRSPGSVQATVALAMAAFTLDEKRINQEELLKLVEQIQDRIKGEEETLPVYITLLARTGKPDIAKQKLADVIKLEPTATLTPTPPPAAAAPTASQIAPPSQPTFIRLAAISDEFKLEMSDQLLRRTQELHGISSPLALFAAQRERRANGPAASLKLFQQAWDSTPNAKTHVGWRVTWATLLTEIDDPRAGREWIALADDQPDNLVVQRLASESRTVQDDRAFLDRAIIRVRELAGEEGTAWRMTRVRWLLARDSKKETTAEAVVLLREVIDLNHDDVAARRLLARCFQVMGNLGAALEQAETAFKLQPQRSDLALELAGMLQTMGDFVKSRDLIDWVLDEQAITRRERQRAAELLAAQGATDFAIKTLEADRPDGDITPDPPGTTGAASGSNQPDILLARLYWVQKQPEKAKPIFESLLAAANAEEVKPNPLLIQMAANFYADQKDAVRAAQVLKMLEKVKLPPGIRDLLIAEHFSRYGDKTKAQAHFAAATEAAPENPNVWRQYAAHAIRQGKLEDAIKIVNAAGQRLPEDTSLLFVRENAPLIERAVKLERLHPMVHAMLTDAENQRVAAESLRIIVESENLKLTGSQLIVQLTRLANRNPRFLLLQDLVASTLIILGQHDDAIRIAVRATETFPISDRPPALAAAAMMSAKRWEEAISMATVWRTRAGMQVMSADLLSAEALINLRRSEQAITTLQPWLDGSKPDHWPLRLIELHSRALAAGGRWDDAFSFLAPFQSTTAARALIRSHAVQYVSDRKVAKRWLEHVLDATPMDAVDEKLAIAQALTVCGMRQESRDLTRILAARRDATAAVLFLAGVQAESDGQIQAAESYYRQALNKDKTAVVMNNLAMLMLRKRTDLPGALALAKQAVKERPAQPHFWDTLSLIHMELGNANEAVLAAESAVKVAPHDVEWQVNLLRTLVAVGLTEKALNVDKSLYGKDLSGIGESATVQLKSTRTRLAALKTSPPLK